MSPEIVVFTFSDAREARISQNRRDRPSSLSDSKQAKITASAVHVVALSLSRFISISLSQSPPPVALSTAV